MKSRIISLTAAMGLGMSAFAMNVETDRSWYMAGEPMTVTVTADTPQSAPSKNALIAYAELCDTHGMAAGSMISMKGGAGCGIIKLPPNLHSGYYVLSVYTRHDANVSHRLVAVVNPLRKSVDDDIQWVKITHPDSLSYAESNGEKAMRPFEGTGRFQETPELEGHIITARVNHVYDGKTFSASEILPSLSIVGKQVHYFEGKMVNDSIAVFYTFGIHGRQTLVLSARSSTGVSLPVEMITPFVSMLPKELPHLVFHYQRSEVEARSLDMQRYQMMPTPDVPLDYDDRVMGSKPDLSYNLDEYRQFLTVREVLLEYVSCVKKKKTDGMSQLIVRREQDQYHDFLPSLVLIDGMPVFDTERLLNYDARRIHYINIYGGQYIYGNGVYNGILSFVTRSGQLTNYPTEPNMQYLVYEFPEL